MREPTGEVEVATQAGPLSSPLIPIFLIVLVDVLGFTIILPLLPFYSEHLGASPLVIGSLVATYAVCQLISGPILGQISDRVGRRPILLISQAGTLAGFFLLAFSTHVWMLFVARAIDGATAGNLSIAQAYISDVTKPENRAKSFALIGIAFGFGFLVGPGISGLLARYSYQAPIFVACGLSLITILCTWFLLPRQQAAHRRNEGDDEGPVAPGGKRLSLISWGEYRRFYQNKQLAALLTQWLLFALSFALFISGFALFCERTYTWNGHPFKATEVGYLFSFNGFLGMIMQGGLVGRMVKSMGERRVVRLGFAVAGLGYAAVGFTHTTGQIVGVMVFSALASGLRPTLTSLITQHAGRREQGVIIGLTQSLMSVAQITAPMLAGFLIGRADVHAPGAPENRIYLVLWAVACGLLAGLALLFEPPAAKTKSATA